MKKFLFYKEFPHSDLSNNYRLLHPKIHSQELISQAKEYVLASEAEEEIATLEVGLNEAEAELFETRQAIFREGISAEEYKAQLTAAAERERVLVEALESVLDEVRIIEDEWDADWPMPYPLVNFLESTKLAQARAALAQGKGG